MSTDMSTTADASLSSLPEADDQLRDAPEPVSHGSAVQCVFNDLGGDHDLGVDVEIDPAETLYDAVRQLWYDTCGDRDSEPGLVATLDADTLDWLGQPAEGSEWILQLTSSRWKAGKGEGDDYSAFYEYHLKLRELTEEDGAKKAPIALHVEIMPQFSDLVYKDGEPFDPVYGEGSRVQCWTTWADSPEEIETRMVDALEAAVGADRDILTRTRNFNSRRIAKAEAHHRFQIGWKHQVIESLEQSKSLIGYGGESEIDAHQRRISEGWLECVVDADRWELLGFEDVRYDIEAKVYQFANWHNIPESRSAHHPKLEASFGGVSSGKLPHVEEWDDVMQTLREIVSAHLEWSGVERDQLVADDYQDGPAVPSYEYRQPIGRREQLKERYENVQTEIYREATKANTQSVYDILRTLAVESGASYDTLEERTGLARSTIRHHVGRLAEAGVVEKISNPRLVVFPSLAVLDKAEEIMREIYPDDTVDDQRDRAEERRQRREDRDDPTTDQDDDQDDADDDRRSSRWEYLDDLGIDADQLATAVDNEYLTEDHVRVRTDPYDWLG